jgi:transcription elongation factor Elf1
VFLFNSCFPTNSEESEKKEDQEITNPINPDIDPGDLPEQIDPKFEVNDGSIDSLFNVLLKRVENLENAETPDDVFNTDFITIRNGFATAVSKQPSHVKANVGFIISSICAVNTSANIKKVIDSIQSYIEAVDNYYDEEELVIYKKRPVQVTAKRKLPGNNQQIPLKKATSKKPLVSNIFNRKGIEGVGFVLLAESPKIIAAQTEKPSFPSFLTVSFIQKIVEEDIIPKLNDVLSSCKRLDQTEMSLILTAFDETFELDKGDILLFEAGIRLARAGLGIFTTYNMDIQTADGSSIINLLNDYYDEDQAEGKYIFRLSNDSLYRFWVYNDEKYTSKLSDIVQYNLKRSDFLKIRSANHQWVYSDLKMVPELIKASLKSMKEETDQQNDDLIPAGEIFNLDADMTDISLEMTENGISPSLASRFSSPEALMDFVTEILTKEYTFNETIEGYNISITVDLSKWFTNPVSDLKTLFPKYRLSQTQDRVTSYTYKYYEDWEGDAFYAYPDDIIDIPSSMIASKEPDQEFYYVKLNTNYSVNVWVDSTIYCTPYYLIDDSGKDLPFNKMGDVIYDVQILRECFPYFNDYTFNGLFPKMTTRTSWIDFLSQFYE